MRFIGTTTIAAAVALPFLLGAAAPSGCGSGQATTSQAGQGAGPMPADAPPMTGPAPLGPFSARAQLRGFQETPAISTTGSGRLSARVSDDGTSIAFELSWSGLQGGEATGAHFHIGQRGVPGGIVIHLCGTGGKPACPTQPATLTGTLTSADVVALPTQGIAAGDLAAVLRAMRAGVTYVNVHDAAFPTGEIRGQIRGMPRLFDDVREQAEEEDGGED